MILTAVPCEVGHANATILAKHKEMLTMLCKILPSRETFFTNITAASPRLGTFTRNVMRMFDCDFGPIFATEIIRQHDVETTATVDI